MEELNQKIQLFFCFISSSVEVKKQLDTPKIRKQSQWQSQLQ